MRAPTNLANEIASIHIQHKELLGTELSAQVAAVLGNMGIPADLLEDKEPEAPQKLGYEIILSTPQILLIRLHGEKGLTSEQLESFLDQLKAESLYAQGYQALYLLDTYGILFSIGLDEAGKPTPTSKTVLASPIQELMDYIRDFHEVAKVVNNQKRFQENAYEAIEQWADENKFQTTPLVTQDLAERVWHSTRPGFEDGPRDRPELTDPSPSPRGGSGVCEDFS